MEPMTYCQEHANWHYLGTDESNQHSHTLLSKIYFNIILPCTSKPPKCSPLTFKYSN